MNKLAGFKNIEESQMSEQEVEESQFSGIPSTKSMAEKLAPKSQF